MTAVVISLLLTACFSEWTGEETGGLATVTISLGNSDVSRQLVGLDSTSGTPMESHTYKLKIDNGEFKNFTPGSTITVTTGSHTFEIRAYGNPDTIWTEPNNPHPFPSGTSVSVLRAIGKTSGTVTQSGPNSFSIALDSATEVNSWLELAWAVGDPKSLYSAGRKEIIVLKNPDGFSADATITINREIELRAEGGDVIINRGSDFKKEFFIVSPGGSLAIGADPTTEARTGLAITLDGGGTAPSSLEAEASLIKVMGDSTNNGTCLIGENVTLRNNIIPPPPLPPSGTTPTYTPGGVDIDHGTLTLLGKIIGNTGYGMGGGVNVMNSGTFYMKSGAIQSNSTDDDGNGGGVNIYGGAFYMSGGTIGGDSKGNTATCGGGVSIIIRGTFIMTGGYITGNTTGDPSLDGTGGGVYLSGDIVFDMTGGYITNNTAEKEGGGVFMGIATFNMTGGYITGNSANANGGGVYVNAGTFKINSSISGAEGHVVDNISPASPPNVYITSYGLASVVDEDNNTISPLW